LGSASTHFTAIITCFKQNFTKTQKLEQKFKQSIISLFEETKVYTLYDTIKLYYVFFNPFNSFITTHFVGFIGIKIFIPSHEVNCFSLNDLVWCLNLVHLVFLQKNINTN